MLDLFQKDGKISGGLYAMLATVSVIAMLALGLILAWHLSLTFHIANAAANGSYPGVDVDGYYDSPPLTAWQQRLFDQNLSLSALNLLIVIGALFGTLCVYYQAHVTRLNAMEQPAGLALLSFLPFVFSLAFCVLAVAASIEMRNSILFTEFSVTAFFCLALALGAAVVLGIFLGFSRP